MPSSSVLSWGSICESDTVLSSYCKFAGRCYKELLRYMEKWHLAASSQCSPILSRVYPNIWENMTFIRYQILPNTLIWILVTAFFFLNLNYDMRGNLQRHHWKHTQQTNSHSEKVHIYFHKHTVVCCQVIQLQGDYFEEIKFQNCGRTYTDMLQNQSQNFLRVSRDCALVFHHTGPLKYNHACITLVNVCLLQLICWLYTKLLKAKEFEIWYTTASPQCLHLVGGGLMDLNDLTGYAGGNFMFLVGPPKPDRP
jgi:hypothetical protein